MDRYLRGRRFTLGARRSTPIIKIAKMEGNLMELVGNNPEHRNWKGVAIALAVILAVCGLVVLSVVLLTPENTLPAIPNVNLSDVMEKRWKLPEDIWVGDDLIYEDVRGNVVKLSSYKTFPEILIQRQTLKDNGIVDYKISADGKYALLVYHKIPIYTHSFNASYYIYNIQTRFKTPLVHADSVSTFQFAGFGRRGNSVIYSLNGDLYYMPAVDGHAMRITTGGMLGIFHYGLADWLYEEEILKSSVAHWWSPTGRFLAFASFNDKDVEDSFVTIYTDDGSSDVMTYSKEVKYKYPKAGYTNPIVRIHAVDLETMQNVTFIGPTMNGHRLETFQSLTWLNDDELLITWSNRTMTAVVMQQCNPTIPTCMTDVITEQISQSAKGWITYLNQDALPSDVPGLFFFILSKDHGAMGGFNHLAVINKTERPPNIQFLTEGNWEVSEILHYDKDARQVYYISNERHCGSRHVYRVDLNKFRRCVTCNLDGRNVGNGNVSGVDGTKECQYYEASFGERSDRFSVKCLGPGIPYSGIVSINKTGSFSVTLRITRPPDKKVASFILPSARHDLVKREDGTDIRTKTMVPASFHVGKRPIVFFKEDVGSQTVNWKFRVDLASYIVKSIGVVVIFVDGKGSGGRGNQLLHHAAGNPGVFEIEDMKQVLKYFKDEENIDTENVAVVGVSGYGGYLAAISLTHPEFKCAAARSPISDWSLYDSLGSERLLGSPEENPLVYQKNNLLHLIEEISDSKLRIYHGLQDRKVPMQHSVLLKQASMLLDLPLDAVDVTYHPSTNVISETEANKVESNIYESISYFLRNCLFGDSEVGKKKLELLETNYGIPT